MKRSNTAVVGIRSTGRSIPKGGSDRSAHGGDQQQAVDFEGSEWLCTDVVKIDLINVGLVGDG